MRAVVEVAVRLVGSRLNKRRREDIQRALRESELSEEELTELGPFVQAAVEHAGVTRKVVYVFGLVIAGGFVTAGAVLIEFDVLLVGLGVLVLGGGIAVVARKGVGEAIRTAEELEDVLRQNPRWLLRPDYASRYESLLQNTDYDPETYGNYDDVIPSVTENKSSVTVESRDVSPQNVAGQSVVGNPTGPSATSAKVSPSPSGETQSVSDDEALQSRLYGLSEAEFTRLVADLWQRMGWETEVIQVGDETATAVLATNGEPSAQRILIQSRWSGETVTGGESDVVQAANLSQEVEADAALVVTATQFTAAAEERADELGVRLVTGDELVATIEEFESRDLLGRYRQIDDRTTSTRTPRTSGETTGERSQTDGSERGGLAPTGWNRWHWVATVAGVSAFTVGSSSLWTFGILVVAAVYSLYLDIQHVCLKSDWSPRKWFYLPGLLLVLLSLPIYLVNRYRFVSSG